MKVLAGSGLLPSRPTGPLSDTGKCATRLRLSGQKYTLVKILVLCLLVSAASSCTKDEKPKYALGDQGPGMGTIFYVADKPFPCGFELSEYCSFLEVAPAGWSADDKDPVATMSLVPYKYSQYVKDHTATEPVGLGMHNTLVLTSDTNSPASAVEVAAQYNGGGLSDWYVPSLQELLLLQKSQSRSTGLQADVYWSSSEYDTFGTMMWAIHMFNPKSEEWLTSDYIPPSPIAKVDRGYVRPIRAF